MTKEDKKWRDNRRDGFIEIVEFYSYITTVGNYHLSEKQMSQLIETRDHLNVFGEIGQGWAQIADEIINEQLQIQDK